MQVVILTLEKIELHDPNHKFQKVSVTLSYGNNKKSIPKPRFIRTKIASFYGEKISISSTDPSSKNVLLQIYGIAKEQTLIGEVIIDSTQLQKKPGTNQPYKIEQDKFSIQFQAMYSSNMDMSPRAINKTSQSKDFSITSLAQTTSISTRKQQNLPIKLSKRESESSLKEEQSLSLIQKASLNKFKAFQKAQLANSPKPLSRQGSHRKLNRSNSNIIHDEDKKSEISERPKRFQRSIKSPIKHGKQEQAKSESAYIPRKPKNRDERDISITPTKTILSGKSEKLISEQKIRPLKQQRPLVKQQQKLGFSQKDYIQFAIIAFVAMLLGVAFKKL